MVVHVVMKLAHRLGIAGGVNAERGTALINNGTPAQQRT